MKPGPIPDSKWPARVLAAITVAALFASVIPRAWAQDGADADSGLEGSLRWWWSRGKTQWSHNAQSVAPSLGNPTSVLAYEQLDANSLEGQVIKRGQSGWLMAANLGIGTIYRGSLHDTDYLAGQVPFSDSTSTHADGDLTYWTLDVGYDFLRPAPRTSLGVFGGFNYWNERVTVSGAGFSLPAGLPDIPNSVQAINNNARWYSPRLGLIGRAQPSDSLHFAGNVAFVPRTWMRNKDSHYLRPDLGPTPNITMDGTGNGVQAEAEVRYALYKPVELALGVRYWKLKASGNVQFDSGPSLPLNDFQSTRYGATLSLVGRW